MLGWRAQPEAGRYHPKAPLDFEHTWLAQSTIRADYTIVTSKYKASEQDNEV
jgi:hypothetical protein